MPLRNQNAARPRTSHVLLFALGCLPFLACGAQAQRGVSPVSHTLQSSLAGPDFAIADFDGDRQPDLATVEAQPGPSSPTARYFIRFKLTSGDAQVFGVTAPFGGLQLVARDVNGDHALDLLVSTTWQHQQVAVFLNDGHGNFTLAEPSNFAAALSGDENQWSSESLPPADSAVLMRFQLSVDRDLEECRCRCAPRQLGLARQTDFDYSSHLFLSSSFGRAPPAVLQS